MNKGLRSRPFLTCCCLLYSYMGFSQSNHEYARTIVNRLADSSMFGRGYAHGGLDSAKNYIQNEFKRNNLLQFGNSYLQDFSHSVNVFPGSQSVELNGKKLIAGRDYLIQPYSIGVKGKFEIQADVETSNNKYDALLLDTALQKHNIEKLIGSNKVVVSTTEKLTWGASTEQLGFTHILLKEGLLNEDRENLITLNITNSHFDKYTSSNIIGYLIGNQKPDSFIVISAHYDHLGTLGNAYFTGANDNASGIALLLSIAKHYKQNPPPYTIVFIAFAGEELGLLGSSYYVDHSNIPLNKIRFLVNLDIVGTGEEGIKVVNGTKHPNEFELLRKINLEKNLLKDVVIRGEAKNSDHFYFSQKGVPSFFIYTLGGIDAYHDVNDRAETLPLDHIDELVTLLTEFNLGLIKVKHE